MQLRQNARLIPKNWIVVGRALEPTLAATIANYDSHNRGRGKCGVSVTTVSMVLNDAPPARSISETTRKRVWMVANRL